MNKVKLVFAVGVPKFCSDDYPFGNNGALPWNVPEELQHFKEETKDTVLVMGANTFLSLPGKLPGRHHVVLSSKGEHIRTKNGKTADMVISGGNLSTTLDTVRNYYPDKDISIIGGKSLIEEAIKYNIADELVVSFIFPVFGYQFVADTVIRNELLDIDLGVYEHINKRSTVVQNDKVRSYFVERWKKK